MKLLVIKRNPAKIALTIGACALFTAVCAWLLTGADSTFESIMAITGIVFFGLGGIAFAAVNLRNRTLLILNNEGFFDYSSPSARGDDQVRWEHVAAIAPSSNAGEISVHLTEQGQAAAQLHGARKSMNSLSKKMSYGDISIALQTAAYPKGHNRDSLVELMNQYRVTREQQITAGLPVVR